MIVGLVQVVQLIMDGAGMPAAAADGITLMESVPALSEASGGIL